jgi:CHAD domain-containing protein
MIRLIEELDDNGAKATELQAHLRASLKSLWKDFRKEFRCCRSRFSEKSVHQLRIQTRRLLSLLDLIAPLVEGENFETTRRSLKKHLRRLAELRDTHVQARAIRKDLAAFPEARTLCDWLTERERRVTKRLRKKMADARIGDLKDGIAALQQRLRVRSQPRAFPGKQYITVMAAVDKAFAAVAALHAAIDPAVPETIHRTRIAFKRFRYMVELLAPVLPVTPPNMKSMQAYQTLMGDIQDVEVLLLDVDNLLAKKKGLKNSLQPFREELERRRAACIQRFLRGKDRLLKFWPLRPSPPSLR